MLIKRLFLNRPLGEAVDSFRLHHQGIPNRILYNSRPAYRPPDHLIEALEKIGHKMVSTRSKSVVQAIYKDGETIYAKSDSRKGGKSFGF